MLPDASDDLDALNAFLHRSPLHRWLDCRILACDRSAGTVTVHLPDREELHRGEDGAVAHGGVVAALVDIAAHAALHAGLGRGIPTIDMRVDYLRPAVLPLTATATVVRSGANLGSADVVVAGEDGRVAAQGRAVFFTRPPAG
ncbi:PaaI family thioesterase [Acuticoccus sp. M5D2P5]|uniref:PaaI family thioesterase n=1 Tax=Acuticoccus kalidii TaxID=2910977 RepID=UPI001F3F61B4|nr:PaaI family thioesterase [Acuticoccus kalidii]MCF3934941.1 PaaI family thioesterase [Acuticoccus kalidii]